MAHASLMVLLATSVLQPCASDTLRTQVARKLKASVSALPRPNASELRAQVDRRLSMASISQACLSACPDAQDIYSDIMTAAMSLMADSSGSSSGMPDMSVLAELQSAVYDAYCTHRPAVKCIADNPVACSEESPSILAVEPQLDCICDECPSARQALADFSTALLAAMFEAFSGDGSDGSGNGTTVSETELMCAMYSLLSCSTTAPTYCGLDILLPSMELPNVTTDELASMDGTCSSTDVEPAADSSRLISPWWLSAAVLPLAAALRSE